MAEDLLKIFEQQLEQADIPQESFSGQLPERELISPTVNQPDIDTTQIDVVESEQPQESQEDLLEKFNRMLEGRPETDNKGVTKSLNSTASLLGLKPTDLKTGGEEFKQALQGLQVPESERPTVLGGIKESAKAVGSAIASVPTKLADSGLFGGEQIGEAVGGFFAQGQEEERRQEFLDFEQNVLSGLTPSQRRTVEPLLNDNIDTLLESSKPSTAQVLADMGEVAIDLVTLGAGSAAKAGFKAAAKDALKTGGKKGLKQFFINQGKKQATKGAGLGATTAALSSFSDTGDVEDAVSSSITGALLGGTLGGAFDFATAIQKGKGEQLREIMSSPEVSKNIKTAFSEERGTAARTGFLSRLFGSVGEITPQDNLTKAAEALLEEVPKLNTAQADITLKQIRDLGKRKQRI